MANSVILATSALLCTTAVVVVVQRYRRDPSHGQAFADLFHDRVALAVWAGVTAAYVVGGIVWQGSIGAVIPGLSSAACLPPSST